MACMTSYTLSQKPNMVEWKEGSKNVSKCDTKGCIPLEVQIKRYLLAGRKLEEMRAENTFEDYDDAYKDIPIITQDMDITEILELENQAKLRLAQLAAQHKAEAVSTESDSVGAKEVKRVAPTSKSEAVESVDEA